MAKSVFESLDYAESIETDYVRKRYEEDTNPQKVNLSVEAFRTDEGKPFVLPIVRATEVQIAYDKRTNHEYLPVAGNPDFRDAAIKLILGRDSRAFLEETVLGIQCPGGTGCLRLAAEFLKRQLGYDTVYVSKPTWGGHKDIFKQAFFSKIVEYRYWDQETRGLDFSGMLEDLKNAPEKSVVILQAVAHNPTGVDPTKEQWQVIANVCQEKNLFVVMDNAYQGIATGNLDEDAYSSRLFEKIGLEFFIAQSFSKNFGLYNERTGNLCVVAKDPRVINKVQSQMEMLVRTMLSNPPNHGAEVAAVILNNKAYCADWKQQVNGMADRIKQMRRLMFDKLRNKGTPGDWDHIITQKGMFCYTGLTHIRKFIYPDDLVKNEIVRINGAQVFITKSWLR